MDLLDGMALLAAGTLAAVAYNRHSHSNNPFDKLQARRIDWRKVKYTGGVHPFQPYPITQHYTGGRVKGLFIGINYFGTKGELRGCINDVATMLDTLKALQFPLYEAAILVDDPAFGGAGGPPTREMIIRHMQWLVHDAKPGDVLFFHYSGHGSRTRDLDGDEDDGWDETLVPVDYASAGCIVDDDIFEIMVRHLPAGVRMTAVMDCCHSGSLMDLPFTFVANAYNLQRSYFRMTAQRGFERRRSNGDVIMFSGCADNDTSADVSNAASFGNPSYGSGGACTNALANVLTKTKGCTISQLLEAMRTLLRQRRYHQVPQLSTTKPLDLNTTFSLFGSLQQAQQFYQPPAQHPFYHSAPPAAFLHQQQQPHQQQQQQYPPPQFVYPPPPQHAGGAVPYPGHPPPQAYPVYAPPPARQQPPPQQGVYQGTVVSGYPAAQRPQGYVQPQYSAPAQPF